MLPMFLYQTGNSVDFRPAKSARLLQGNRIQPEFCHLVLSPYVDVWRLVVIKGNKEKSVGAYSQNSGHFPVSPCWVSFTIT